MNTKKIATGLMLFIAMFAMAQQSANRFFYELTFKPKKDSAKTEKVMTTLDIAKEKSQYQDFTVSAQDSIIKAEVDMMQKSGTYKDLSKLIKMPKFTYKITKAYPSMKQTYLDRISVNLFGYEDDIAMKWNILSEKSKIGAYNVQKATTEYGGRKWTAWFSEDLPFQDGPYRFAGLPGLIVKVEDDGKNYSWELKGNETIKDWKEFSYAEELNAKFGMSNEMKVIPKDRFEKAFKAFKQDPMAEARARIPQAMLGNKIPGSDQTIGEMLKSQEKLINDFFNATDNSIEIPTEATKVSNKKK